MTGGGNVLQDNKDVAQEVVQTHLVIRAHGHLPNHPTHQDHPVRKIAGVINVEGHQTEKEAKDKIIIGHVTHQGAETLPHTQAYLRPRLHRLRQVSEKVKARALLSQDISNKSKMIVVPCHQERLLATKNILMSNNQPKN